MELRSFEHEDVGQAKELSDAAGWNQIESDWHRIINIQPDGCLGAWEGDRLVGTTTFVTYAKDLAWIGMVLVHPDYRGRGIGTRLVRTAMEVLGDRNITVVGLDATESGRPLYEREGFHEVAPIVRWSGTLRSLPAADFDVESISDSDLGSIKRLDHRIAHVDRALLLEQLVEADEVVGFSAYRGDEKPEGYMFLRPGRNAWQVGPLVSSHEDVAKPLLGTAADILEGRGVIVDAVDDFGVPSLLTAAGLEPSRRLMRMAAPRSSRLLTGPSIVAAAGFEWG